jgi:DNA-binding transcriptional regulator YiaG
MKNPELIALIKDHKLTSKVIAEMLDVSPTTVTNWRRDGDPKHARQMSRSNLKLLKLSLGV